tara:strand:- start:684 stop:1490 length:807 start_codon:yes stop_codon:yes gene_type:complete
VSNAKVGNLSADKITTGTIASDRISGTYNSVSSLNATTSVNAPSVSGTTSVFTTSRANTFTGNSFTGTTITMGNSVVQFNKAIDSDSYVRGDEFRGNGTTVDIHRNGTSNGIRITGSGSGAYLYGYNSSGSAQIIYSPFSGVSDERLKENVVDLTLGLDEINALRPVTFDWKASDIDDIPNNRYGFIAQEVESVVPTMISTQPATRIDFDEEGEEITVPNVITLDDGTEISEWKSIDEKPLLYMLVKAVQELSTQISDLTDRIEALEG